MKLFLALACGLALALPAMADDRLTFLKAGDQLRLEFVSPSPSQVNKATVVEVGPQSWVLVEYDRSFLKPGESGAKTEKTQVWVNFAHVVSAQKIAK